MAQLDGRRRLGRKGPSSLCAVLVGDTYDPPIVLAFGSLAGLTWSEFVCVVVPGTWLSERKSASGKDHNNAQLLLLAQWNPTSVAGFSHPRIVDRDVSFFWAGLIELVYL